MSNQNPYTLTPGSLPGGSGGAPGGGSAPSSPGSLGYYNHQTPFGGAGAGTSGAFGNNTITSAGMAAVDPSAFQYGGYAGGANNASQSLIGAANAGYQTSAPTSTAATVNNPYYAAGQGQFNNAYSNLGNTGSQYGNLANFYTGMVNGSGPNLATAQLNAANQSNLNNAAALANSGHGGLGSAAGQASAQNQMAQIGQQNAQNAVATNIQQQQLGAAGLANALGGQANVYQGQAGLAGQNNQFNQGAAQYNAGLQQQTNLANAANQLQQTSLNNQFYLGGQGLANQIQNEQLNANMAGQQLQSNNYNTAQQTANQGAQFNATQNQNMFNTALSGIGGLFSGAGSMLGFDADLVEPNKPAQDMAHWTLREEPDFLLAINQRTGELRKLATQPLTPEEHRQAVNRPHGAGPLGADDPRRLHMNYHDYSIPGVVTDPSAMAMQPVIQAAPMTGAGSYDAGATDNPFAAGNPITNGQPAAMPGQQPRKMGGNYFRQMFAGFGGFGGGGGLMAHDLDLSGHRTYRDADVGPLKHFTGVAGRGHAGDPVLYNHQVFKNWDAVNQYIAQQQMARAQAEADAAAAARFSPQTPQTITDTRVDPGQPVLLPAGTGAPADNSGTIAPWWQQIPTALTNPMANDLDLSHGGVYNDAPIGPEPWDAPVRDPWEAPQSLAGLGIGDQGSAQALAATQPPAAPPPAVAAAAASDPLKAALWRGEISPQQYDAVKASKPSAPANPAAAPTPPAAAAAKVDPSTLSFAAGKTPDESAAATAPLLAQTMNPVRTAWQSTMAPDQFTALKAADKERLQAADDLGRAQFQLAEDEGVGHALKGAKIAEQGKEMADLRTRNESEVRGIEDHISDLSDEVANAKIDPEHFWHSQSTGNKIRYGIATMFGALGAALSHSGENKALEQINAKIGRDLDEQKAQIERKKGKIGDMQGLLASAYRRTGNMEQAMAAAHAVALQQVDEEQQAYAASSKSQVALAQAQAHSADIKAMVAENIASHEKQVQTGGGGEDLRAAYHRYADDWLKGNHETEKLDFNQWLVQRGGAGHEAVPKPGAAGGKKSATEMLSEAQAQVNAVRAAPNSSLSAGNVGNAITRGLGIQGTKGQDAEIAQGSYNTSMKLNLHQWGVRLADPEKAQEFISQWELKPNDTPTTVQKKTDAYLNFMRNQGANTAGPSSDVQFKADE